MDVLEFNLEIKPEVEENFGFLIRNCTLSSNQGNLKIIENSCPAIELNTVKRAVNSGNILHGSQFMTIDAAKRLLLFSFLKKKKFIEKKMKKIEKLM